MKSQKSRSTQSNRDTESWSMDMTKVFITIIGFFIWIMLFGQFSRSLQYQSTRLIMRSAGCHYVELHNLPTHAYSVPDTCSVTASFRSGGGGWGGEILQGASYIELADNQILVAEVLPEQPWTEPQISAAKWFGLVGLALLGLLAVWFL